MPDGLNQVDVEDAIISQLQPLLIENDGPVRVIRGYQGEVENEEQIKKHLVNFPSIFVVWLASSCEDAGRLAYRETMRYCLVVADKCLRNESSARKGGLSNPGTYTLLQNIRDILNNSRLTIDNVVLPPLKLDGEYSLYYAPGVSVYGAFYRIEADGWRTVKVAAQGEPADGWK